MMAEDKFHEVQKLIEIQLALKTDVRHELLPLYYQSLKSQNKKLPINLLLELLEIESKNQNHDFVLELLGEISPEERQKFFIEVTRLKILAAEDKGQMDDIYGYLSEFLIRQYEKQMPYIPSWASKLIDKYFKQDFSLTLKELALNLLLGDLAKAENLTRELILQCFEKSSPKGISNRLFLVGEILKTGSDKNQLEIYRNFCVYFSVGTSDKADFKRIVEMIIFYNDFNFQVLVLSLLDKLGLNLVAEEYAEVIKENSEYNYVYLDKYFTHLKRYFYQVSSQVDTSVNKDASPDLKLTGKIKREVISPLMEIDEVEDEKTYFNLIKYQKYTPDQLCDLTVSFLQSEMPNVALYAVEKALSEAQDDVAFLKCSYLKLSCLLLLKEFRAALDTCLVALSKATSEADILSFLYGQAEVHIRLNEVRAAKQVLSKIIKIDASYRLTKERLDKLNEI